MKEKVLIVEDQFIEADYLRQMLLASDYTVCTLATSVAQAEEILKEEKPTFVLLDIFLKGKETGIDLAKRLRQRHIPFVYLSANSNEEVLTLAKATHPEGFLVKPFHKKDLLVTLEIARYRHSHSVESSSIKEATVRQEIADLFRRFQSLLDQLESIPRVIQPFLPFDFITIDYVDPDTGQNESIRMLRIGYDEYQTIGDVEFMNIMGSRKIEQSQFDDDGMPLEDVTVFHEEQFNGLTRTSALKRSYATTFDLQASLHLGVKVGRHRFHIWTYSKRSAAYSDEHVSIGQSIRAAMESGIALGILQAKDDFDTHSPNATASPVDSFKGIIGKSHRMLNVLDYVQTVAPSDTAVLILGESGTGKEKISDCIHQMSTRSSQAFVKVNCAALPSSLIESELFGHEKGAFTGAHEKRIGRFEQADKGTIFLDEIGELPIEFQAKLLRVIQEKVVERVGSSQSKKVDVRIIAATNRNLEKEVAEGRFRLDLYYRLNVFPITLPALRDRKEDIPDLIEYFKGVYNTKTGRRIQGFSSKAITKLSGYTWPGNIRELENLVERNILLAKTLVIDDIVLPPPNHSAVEATSPVDHPVKSMEQNEKDHILAVLQKCNGRIWGAGAAAELLKIPPSTLKSKMKKLGIAKRFD
jgi:DNA-binding NtrC family response regulator